MVKFYLQFQKKTISSTTEYDSCNSELDANACLKCDSNKKR